MTRHYFGTDGIRGRVGQHPITPDFVLRLGMAAGRILGQHHEQPTVLIGKDTRISGYMLEAALEAGFASAGVDVVLAGPMPTPPLPISPERSGYRPELLLVPRTTFLKTTALSSLMVRAKNCLTPWSLKLSRPLKSRWSVLMLRC
jgi:hypothetical protein